MKYSAVFFDLDGTISDSKLGITKSVQYALSQYGIEAHLGTLEKFVGPPLHESFMKFYNFEKHKAMEAVEYFRVYFSERGIFENQPYEGIFEMLQKLNNAGIPLYIATSKPTVYAEKILKKDKLTPFFKAILGSELDGSRSQKREVISDLMIREALNPNKVLMVGDREHDLLGARDNQVDAVGVLYGYGDYDELIACKPIHILESVRALETYLLSILE